MSGQKRAINQNSPLCRAVRRYRKNKAAMVCLCLFLLILLLVRGRAGGRLRLGAVLLALLSVYPLWHFVYSNTDLYWTNTFKNNNIGVITKSGTENTRRQGNSW